MIFPIIHQHDSMQCGIACLQMVCKYFGREYSLDSLSKLCFATAEGVSLLGINEKSLYLVSFIGTKITLLSCIKSRKERTSM